MMGNQSNKYVTANNFLYGFLTHLKWGSSSFPNFKNIFDFTTAGDWDCVAVVEPLPALHYSVDFIFLSFRIMGFIVEL